MRTGMIFAGVMDLLENEVVARFYLATEVVIHEADEDTDRSQQQNEPVVRFAYIRGDIERPQEQRGR